MDHRKRSGRCTEGAIAQGPVRLGSDEHKVLFCRALLSTFDPYKPAVIDWRLWFELRVAAVWAFLACERVGLAHEVDGAPRQDNNFTVTGTRKLGVDVSLRGLIDVCLAENDRRLRVYDRRLVRPKFIPNLARLARRFLPPVAPVAA